MPAETSSKPPLVERLLPASAVLLSALLAGCLGWLAWSGTLTRYWADDYCYSYVMRAGGLLRGPIDWYISSGNRFSTIYLAGLQDAFGPAAIRALPGLVLLAWGASWLFFLFQGAALARFHLSLRWALPFAFTQVFFAVLTAPDRLQTFYWRMGTLHYTFPLLLLLLCVGLAARQARAARPHAGWSAALFLLAFFAGGFSETYAALQAALYALALALSLPFPAWRKPALDAFLPLLLGALAAMLLELLSPSNAWRQAALPPPSSLGQLLEYILRYTADFTRDTLRGLPLPLLVLALSSAGLAWAGFWRSRSAAPAPRTALLAAAASLLAGLLLCAAAIAPSVYAGLQFPAGRALMPARFALLAGLSAAAFWLGALPCSVPARGQSGLALLAALILLAAGLYPLRALAALEPQRRELAAWAARWDARDAQIRASIAAGQGDVLTRQVEVVSGLEDIGPNPLNWVNRCAAGYYQLRSIVAKP